MPAPIAAPMTPTQEQVPVAGFFVRYHGQQVVLLLTDHVSSVEYWTEYLAEMDTGPDSQRAGLFVDVDGVEPAEINSKTTLKFAQSSRICMAAACCQERDSVVSGNADL